jgi:EAL domain-containing protein (putative c-di-GMP-specific phosphodiesterase class I)
VVAEGVEDEATLQRLKSFGCDLVQGFFVSRPVSAARLGAWHDDLQRAARLNSMAA